jgi:predicted negative regulator of RcsB-dependent stress response
MSTFLTEEQQIERIKTLWKQYGNLITNTVLAAIVVLAGWQFWQSRQLSLQEKASILYKEMMVSVFSHEESGVEAYGKRIVEDFPGTVYADFAQLHRARIDINNDRKKAALERLASVVADSTSNSIRQIARIRQARVIVAMKHYDKALKLLDTVDDTHFLALVAQTRGDIYSLQGLVTKAREQYQVALNHLPNADNFGALLKMKLHHLPTTQPSGAQA